MSHIYFRPNHVDRVDESFLFIVDDDDDDDPIYIPFFLFDRQKIDFFFLLLKNLAYLSEKKIEFDT